VTEPVDRDEEMRQKQAETRATLDRGLAKYGWKLGKIRGRGITVVYELVHLTDANRVVAVPIGIEEIMQWTLQDEQSPVSAELAALGISTTSLQLYLRLAAAAIRWS